MAKLGYSTYYGCCTPHFLELRDVVRLDSGVCVHGAREGLLNALRGLVLGGGLADVDPFPRPAFFLARDV
jgi:hypothetical protein